MFPAPGIPKQGIPPPKPGVRGLKVIWDTTRL